MRTLKIARLSLLVCAVLAAGGARAAIGLNMYPAGATGQITGTNQDGGAVIGTYTQVDDRPMGSGYIDSFVRIGMPGGGPGNNIMEAYNTTANVLNNSSDDTFNHEITVGQVGFIGSGTSSFMRFILDINQNKSGPGRLLNLDEVQIFISTSPNQDVTTFTGGVLDLASDFLVYRQDGISDHVVILDYSLNGGSGNGDMTLDISKSAFDAAFAKLGMTTEAAQNGAYIYLYSKFGSAPNENTDGYEEWAHTGAGTPVVCTNPNDCGGGGGGNPTPEPGSLAMVALGLFGMRRALKRRAT